MSFVKDAITFLADPRVFFILLVVGFIVVIWKREIVVRTDVALGMATVAVVFFAASMFDPNFRKIVTKPDNVPIVGMLFLVPFFMWYSLRQAVLNDRAEEAGEPVLEKKEEDRVWVWPDLVYTELIALVLCSVLLIVWSIYLKAPLEQPANRSVTPNPSKAPWYFLGLQEMLVYFDPWLAGVVLPGLIIVGLMAIPYIDVNPKGNGYFSFKNRKWEVSLFLFGFVILWVSLISIGTFLRGPNWNFFGPYEYWDVHKLLPLTNVNLSEYIWLRWLGTGLPANWLVREVFGIGLVILYIFAVPPLLGRSVFRRFYDRMGPARYYVGMFLFLMMMSLPVKMLLRWAFNLKYIVAIPEYFFNI